MNRRTFIRGAVIAASTPAAIGAIAFTEFDFLHRRYLADREGWLATADEHGDITASGPEYDRAWTSCKDVVRYQCKTLEEAQMKIKTVMESGWLQETAEIGFGDEPFHFHHFLKTLIVPSA